MKTLITILGCAFFTVALFSCKKNDRTTGICYCSYYSGDETQYDLQGLSRGVQVDSCNELNRLAEAFVGNCELE